MKPKLKFLDRYLTLWIFIAMMVGIGIGYFFPSFRIGLERMSNGTTNIPLAIGLILMMYPPLTRVDYSLLPVALEDKRALFLSLFLNWIIGPLLMFLFAIIFLSHHSDYMVGLILIGLARCIAMVIVWNDLAGGNREYAALLVALNSIFQMITYSVYAWFFIQILPAMIGLGDFHISVPFVQIVESVFVYLGIPFLFGFISRYILIRQYGKSWFQTIFVPVVSPITLYALLFTIVLMFSLKGDQIVHLPLDVVTVAIPMICYFVTMFFISFFLNRALGLPYDQNVAISFTATGNNFELAIAVAIAVYGVNSPQAFVGVIGPLVEVPVLILLVRVSLYLRSKFYQ